MLGRLFKGSSRLFHTSRLHRAEVEVFIDGKSVKIEQGAALIQACEKAGVDIPRFCYHDRLSVAGNCRMCLVELEKAPKPIASCAMPVMPGMKVKTNTPLVKKAREGVMEFLLANHPLDCPVCDQGGECDLQDQSVRYGSDKSRFNEFVGKRAVEDKNLGPLVKTSMTRCIHCTRCVRFANEVAGAVEMGTSGRGNDMQIGTYIEKAVNSELSGNIIDLCPVGALTSKPYAFNARPWELKKTESIDVSDAVGSNIRVDSRGLEVLRVVPRINDDINEEWISDKTRFSYDGLKRQRLTVPMIRQGDNLVPCSWQEALVTVAQRLKSTDPSQIAAIAGQHADAESMVALKDLLTRLGVEAFGLDTSSSVGFVPGTSDFRSNYLFNSTINAIEASDWLLLIGTNPRHEAAVLNSRIRKTYLHYKLDVGVIGQAPNLNYEYENLGDSIKALKGNSEFLKKLGKAEKPMVVVGSGVFEHAESAAILREISSFVLSNKQKFIHDDWRGFNVLQRAASFAAANDVGFTGLSSTQLSKSKLVYLLNADEFTEIPSDAFVVYQGHHGDAGASRADVVLPGAAFTEKSATFVNTEGRAQLTNAAVAPPGAAREDWKIVRALSQVANRTLPYDDISGLRIRMSQVSPTLVEYETIEPCGFIGEGLSFLSKQTVSSKSEPLELPIQDFYMTDAISRASPTMAKCSQTFTHQVKPDEKQELIAV